MAFLRVHIDDDIHNDFELEGSRTSIGRNSDNDVVLTNPSVSNHHARLNHEEDFFLTDLRSSNGTFLNGKKIFHVKLSDGDLINFAGINATFFE
ncbi:MAG: FHA domain-containing protein [Gammaproteobacteria bacterium]|nr:FHA domain-containing protein [Gammaproteobacteria bacterium]